MQDHVAQEHQHKSYRWQRSVKLVVHLGEYRHDKDKHEEHDADRGDEYNHRVDECRLDLLLKLGLLVELCGGDFKSAFEHATGFAGLNQRNVHLIQNPGM